MYLESIFSSPKIFFIWVAVSIGILFYPMFVSIYVFLPLFIGVAGYAIVLGFCKDNYVYVTLGLIYLLNLEINLTLPFLFSVVAVLFFYLYIYRWTTIFHNCRICKPILSVIAIDAIYFLILTMYDFIFEANSIDFNFLLLYSVVVDMVMVVAL